MLGAIALVVFALDLWSKRWALAHLGGHDRWFGETLRLTLLHNHDLAWGLSLGTLTPLGTTLVTTALVALMLRVCRDLAARDSLAPVMLGLLAGAGLANGLDVFLGPSGVVDFIAFPVGGGEAVLNVADVAAAIGLALCGRTVYILARAIGAERNQSPVVAMASGSAAPIEIVRELPLYLERPDGTGDQNRPRRPTNGDRDRPESPSAGI